MNRVSPRISSQSAEPASNSPDIFLPPGFRLLSFKQLNSTNEEAKARARAGEAAGTILLAEEQSAGYGRRGRSWVSPKGNLAISFILRPDCKPARAAEIGFVAALALHDAIRPMLPAAAALHCKWPNDLLLDGGKVAGILLESEFTPDGALAWLILGIGVNILAHPPETAYPATSLAERGASIAAIGLLEALVPCLAAWMERWRLEGFAPIRAEWLDRAIGLGEAVTVRLDDGEIHGRFSGLDTEGALLVETASGQRRVLAGDVFPPDRTRPAGA